MASQSYKERLILSRPDHPVYKFWRPYAKLMWQDENGFHSHDIRVGKMIFETENKR
jgi:hypothetical protein